MSILLSLLAALALLALLYWLIVIGEATYLGRYAVRFIYQHGARFYDAARQGVTADDERDLLPVLYQALAERQSGRVLDVATGTGRVPLLLARQAWFYGTLHGIDLAPAMLAQARAKLAQAGLSERVTISEGNAGALPWPDSAFDLVISLEALEFFPRPRRALAEMARVLAPGGVLVVSKFPDRWARMLPFKAITRRGMLQVLGQLHFDAIEIREWQPGHYELVIAKKV